MQVAGVVEGNGFQEEADSTVYFGRGGAGVQHGGGVVGAGGGGDHHAGDVAQRGDRVVVVEVAAEALLVAVAGDPDDNGVAVLDLREESQGGRLAADLIGGVVQVSQVLDL